MCLLYVVSAIPALRAWALLAYAFTFVPSGAFILLAWNEDDRFTLVTIMLFAVAARVPLALGQPLWSDDAYRYVWDGRLANRGLDPRALAPNDPALDQERASPLWPHIDWRSIPTVYPPLGIVLFQLSARLDPDGIAGPRIFSLAGDFATIAILCGALRRLRLPRGRLALYAVHPLVLISFAQDAHLESIAIAGSCLALTGTRFARAPGLAVGILTKLYPLVLAPLIFARDRAGALATAALVVAAYVPAFIRGHAFGSLGSFVGSQQFNDTIFPVSGPIGATCVLISTTVIATIAVRRGAGLAACALAVAVMYLLTTPNALPWYVTIVPALLILVPEPFAKRKRALSCTLLWWSATVAFSYSVPWYFAAGSLPDIGIRAIEYIPLIVAAIPYLRNSLGSGLLLRRKLIRPD